MTSAVGFWRIVKFVVRVDLIHRGVSVTVDAETLGEKVAC